MKSFKIQTENVAVRSALLSLSRSAKLEEAVEVGDNDNRIPYAEKYPWFVYNADSGGFCFAMTTSFIEAHTPNIVSLSQAIELIQSVPAQESFTAGDKKVTIYSDGTVVYGCTTVSKETADKIFAIRQKLMFPND
jgi:hypothetical protein